MNITTLTLKHFRCFDSYTLEFKAPLVIIQGHNGTGKTSVLEALHYACYLRSFRTHAVRELIAFDQPAFHVTLKGVTNEDAWDIQFGRSSHKKMCKLNGAPLRSYKELISIYRTVSILEQDLALITGSPDERRSLIDQALLLCDPSAALLLKRYRHFLDQRNALLHQPFYDATLLDVLTQELWHIASLITHKRIELLALLERHTHALLEHMQLPHECIHLVYQAKVDLSSSYQLFKENAQELFLHERILKRTLFGPHLDDIGLLFNQRSSKSFASRGQQKLVLFLFKLAQCRLHNSQVIILLDDVMTDFDTQTLEKIVPLTISLASQLLITTPIRQHHVEAILQKAGLAFQVIQF